MIASDFNGHYRNKLILILILIISPLTSQLWMASTKIMMKYVEPVVIYKIIDLHNYLLMTLDGKNL